MGELLLAEPLDTMGIDNTPSNTLLYSIGHLPQTDFLCINVGGKSYRIRHKTIQMREARPNLLGQLSIASHQQRIVMCDGFFVNSEEYYFERTSKAVDPIIDFYMTGQKCIRAPLEHC
jgi:hypothetical protein